MRLLRKLFNRLVQRILNRIAQAMVKYCLRLQLDTAVVQKNSTFKSGSNRLPDRVLDEGRFTVIGNHLIGRVGNAKH